MAEQSTFQNLFAPVAIFAYNRPAHLSQCLNSLELNSGASETEIFIFIDGPKNSEDARKVSDVMKVANKDWNFRKVSISCSNNNRGLAMSIFQGVDRIFQDYERVIVVEDDLEFSKYFLEFCNTNLSRFESDLRVASIHGYSPISPKRVDGPYFLRGADCWGWATWKNRWEKVNRNSQELIEKIYSAGLADDFNLGGTYDYTGMLERQIKGINDSWAIRWHASMFLLGKLTLNPDVSLVRNTGMDGSGTHSSKSKEYNVKLARERVLVGPIEILESKKALKALKNFRTRNRRRNVLKNRLRRLIPLVA